MSNETSQTKSKDEAELPVGWKQIQTAIWLIGLALLAWKGWWWPGILILVAISGLFQGAVTLYLNSKKEQAEKLTQDKVLEQERANWLPAACPKCGGPISVATVKWTGPNTADCPYCGANLKPQEIQPAAKQP